MNKISVLCHLWKIVDEELKNKPIIEVGQNIPVYSEYNVFNIQR